MSRYEWGLIHVLLRWSVLIYFRAANSLWLVSQLGHVGDRRGSCSRPQVSVHALLVLCDGLTTAFSRCLATDEWTFTFRRPPCVRLNESGTLCWYLDLEVSSFYASVMASRSASHSLYHFYFMFSGGRLTPNCAAFVWPNSVTTYESAQMLSDDVTRLSCPSSRRWRRPVVSLHLHNLPPFIGESDTGSAAQQRTEL